MMRKGYIIGMMAVALTGTALRNSPVIMRVVCSAQELHQQLRESQSAGGPLSPIERLVFSLLT